MAKTHPEKAAIARRGLMLVLSSPSGAGKTTLSRRLLDEDKGVTLSVSVTTRKMRPGEKAGRDYTFIDRKGFDALIEKDELLEWAEVFDNYYGTPRKPVMDALAAGHDVLFDIDWQGTQQLREKARNDLVSVFILPPSVPELEQRLHKRAQDDYETIHRRMAKASDEIESLGRVRLRRDQPRSRSGFRRRQGSAGRRAGQARAPAGPLRLRARAAGEAVRRGLINAVK